MKRPARHPRNDHGQLYPRRRVLGWAGKLGLGAVASVAALAADPERAEAAAYYCCVLGSSTTCPGSGANYTCPSGYYKRFWYCCHSTGRYIGCGECARGSSGPCGQSPWACSKGWVTSNPCE